MHAPLLMVLVLALEAKHPAATPDRLTVEQQMLESIQIRPGRLKLLSLETPLVTGGRGMAVICHADEPAWREAAVVVQRAVREATGVELPLVTDRQFLREQFAAGSAILIGQLNNHRWVGRLYHNFFDCLDAGYTGRTGYEIRSVHSPFGGERNFIVVGGSFAEGTRRAAAAFAELVRRQGRRGELRLGRLLEIHFDPEGRSQPIVPALSPRLRDLAILWDLIEESDLFSDQERLELTNLVIRLSLECVVYQGWNRPDSAGRWKQNTEIVHNHNTFPALGVLFVANYLKRHYAAPVADEWLAVARGIFNGQKHASKPLEDAAAYQWLPVVHTMIYSLAEEDMAFFQEGHAREAARVALMVLDNAGYQAAFGDNDGLKSASAMKTVFQVAAWYYHAPELAWGARLVSRDASQTLDQEYALPLEPRAPAEHVGVSVSRLPKSSYDYAVKRLTHGPGPNLPYEQTFDKLTLRAGWKPDDEYLLLDGFGRGNHMHYDANSLISFASGGEPLLVDGEYIKSAPKYHNALVVIRDGQAEPAPAVTGLGRADHLLAAGYTRTWVTGYRGTQWTRTLLWRPANSIAS